MGRRSVDVSETRNTGARGSAAFQPPIPAHERRAAKERVPSRLRELRSIRDRIDCGLPVHWRDEQRVMWASPSRIAEQRRLTGDAYVPRAELARRERDFARGGGDRRTGIKRTFTGRAVVERGHYRELSGEGAYGLERRVRRAFDWPRPVAEDADEF